MVIAPPLAGRVIGSVGADFVVAEWKDPGAQPGPARWIAPLHLHHNDDEAWYLLEGALRSGWERHCGGARWIGSFRAARHASHLLEPGGRLSSVPADHDLEYLIDPRYTYSLIQDIHAMPERSPAALRAVFEQHDSELVGE